MGAILSSKEYNPKEKRGRNKSFRVALKAYPSITYPVCSIRYYLFRTAEGTDVFGAKRCILCMDSVWILFFDDLSFCPFQQYLVISGRWAGYNEMLCTVELRLRLKRFPPRAGLEPGGAKSASAKPTETFLAPWATFLPELYKQHTQGNTETSEHRLISACSLCYTFSRTPRGAGWERRPH